MKKKHSFKKLISTIETLRGPHGCPWDKEQTHESIKNELIEETYEVIEAIDKKNTEKLKEELGDLLLHIIFQSQIAKEKKEFDIYDVITEITEKMIRRHPHVFGNIKVKDSKQVLENWEKIKSKEKNNQTRTSLTDGIPQRLPALMKAAKIQKKVAKVGFDWQVVDHIISKIEEELEEVKTVHNKKQALVYMQEEIGDLLFAVVNLARFLHLCPEESLNKAIKKFRSRFIYIEKNIQKKFKKNLNQASITELEALWQEAKKNKKLS